MSERHGLLAAGNFIIDHVKMIDAYPAPEMLANIRSQSRSNGGGPYNVLKDLAMMSAPFSLEAAGLTGDDSDGEWIHEDCGRYGIGTRGLRVSEEAATSYTDAMTVVQGGQRTFFHHRGANAIFGAESVNLRACEARWFYLGYLLLLDRMDTLHEGGSTEAGNLLAEARKLGFLTAIDFVSVPDERARAIAAASLPHTDLLFINEIEAEMVTGLTVRSADGAPPSWEAMEVAARALLEAGVRDAVVLHARRGALVLNRDGERYCQGAVRVPEDAIVGSTGAGDAFAAGVLYGRHEDWDWPASLELGVCAAAISLGDETPSGAMRPAQECLERGRAWGFDTP